MTFYVYSHTSPSGKAYVGWAKDPTKRWRGHVRSATTSGSQLAFHRAIRKYGPSAFTSQLLERVTTEASAKLAERLWIAELGTFMPRGYNMTRGGDGTSGLRVPHLSRRGVPHSAEHRAKIGAANRRRTLSAETRAKIGASHRGLKQSPEHVEKKRQAQLGRKDSPETCAKRGASIRAACARRRAKNAV